jgi:hypothetical protein
VPEKIVQQDGDHFLFQLYRRWGSSSMIPSLLRRSGKPQHIEQRAKNWTFETLDEAVEKATQWLQSKQSTARWQPMVTLDVVIPCYIIGSTLRGILSLKPTDTCSVMLIIIIDDPHSPNTSELERLVRGQIGQRTQERGTNG